MKKSWHEAARDAGVALTVVGMIGATLHGEHRDHVSAGPFSPGPVYTNITMNATMGSASMYGAMRYKIQRSI